SGSARWSPPCTLSPRAPPAGAGTPASDPEQRGRSRGGGQGGAPQLGQQHLQELLAGLVPGLVRAAQLADDVELVQHLLARKRQARIVRRFPSGRRMPSVID